MNWQDYTVWAIGVVVLAIIVRRAVCFFRGRRRGGCASCGTAGCPLKTQGRKTNRSK